MATTKRARVWSFIGYPGDSLPDNYREILCDEMHLCWAESPVHDADLNGDGSEKKKHIHFIIAFEGMKSFDQICEITERLHCPIPQVCRNPRGLVRYFIHIDNPDKHQYKVEDIRCYGGFEIDDYFKKSGSEMRQVLMEIQDFCIDNDIHEFCQLADICLKMGNVDWYDAITSRYSVFLSAYLKSKHFMFKEELNLKNQERGTING